MHAASKLAHMPKRLELIAATRYALCSGATTRAAVWGAMMGEAHTA